MLLPANSTSTSTRSASAARDLLLRRVAVEDGRQLVAQDERHRQDRPGAGRRAGPAPAPCPASAIDAARAAAWRELWTVRKTVSAVSGTLICLTASGGLEAARVPADRARALHDEHRRAVDVLRDLVDQVGQDLGEAGALLDLGERGLQAVEAGAGRAAAAAAAGWPRPRRWRASMSASLIFSS